MLAIGINQISSKNSEGLVKVIKEKNIAFKCELMEEKREKNGTRK